MNTNINKFLTINEKNIFEKSRIAVAGCGGLGSNILHHLVRAGIKNFVIADFDVVSESNLNRQFYFADQVGRKKVDAICENLSRICDDLDIKAYDIKVNSENIDELFKDCDIIVEAFDNADAKMMLINHFVNKNIRVVAASGMAGWGNSDEIKVNKVNDNLFIVGDLTREVNEHSPPQSARVGIVASKQANTVIALLLDMREI